MAETLYPPSAPTDVVQANPVRGSLPGWAKPDHVHTGAGMISAVAPTNSAPGDAAATGGSLAVPRRDHLHGREAFGTTAGTVAQGDHTHAGGAHTHVYSETPAGTIDGANDDFTLAATPTAGTLQLYKNGLRQRAGAGNDYTLAVATVTYEAGNIPQTGDSHVADYAT